MLLLLLLFILLFAYPATTMEQKKTDIMEIKKKELEI